MLPAQMRVVARIMSRGEPDRAAVVRLIANVSSDWRAPGFQIFCEGVRLPKEAIAGTAVVMIVCPTGIDLREAGSEVRFQAEKVTILDEEVALKLGLEARTLFPR